VASSVQHSSAEVKLVAWCHEVCAPVLSDRRHAYRTHGDRHPCYSLVDESRRDATLHAQVGLLTC